MIADFKSEVNSKLEPGEIIEKTFEARNYEMIDQLPNQVIVPGAFLVNGDKSFKYSFVITNNRVFIGSVNPFNEVLSSTVHNRYDVDAVALNSIEKEKGFQAAYMLYGLGLIVIPITICYSIERSLSGTFISDYMIIVKILVFVIFFSIIKFLAKIVKRISTPNELGIQISLTNNKTLTVILDDIKNLTFLKKSFI